MDNLFNYNELETFSSGSVNIGCQKTSHSRPANWWTDHDMIVSDNHHCGHRSSNPVHNIPARGRENGTPLRTLHYEPSIPSLSSTSLSPSHVCRPPPSSRRSAHPTTLHPSSQSKYHGTARTTLTTPPYTTNLRFDILATSNLPKAPSHST